MGIDSIISDAINEGFVLNRHFETKPDFNKKKKESIIIRTRNDEDRTDLLL
jgi:hypothetical protein